MAGVFDFKSGAFDSSEAGRLYEAYDIALHGLRTSQNVDQSMVNRLARSIVKVARTEPDCLKNDGTIDPARLAQRAILRMLQLSAPQVAAAQDEQPTLPERPRRRSRVGQDGDASPVNTTGKIMLRLFDRTTFAKL